MPDFSIEVSEWVNKVKGQADGVFRAIGYRAVARVQMLTPVDTGFLRSNWTAVKKGDPEPVAGRVPSPTTAVSELRLGEVLIILNPTVYARRIEYGFVGEDSLGRHYNQEGRHMVGQTYSEMPAIAQQAIVDVTGGAT